MPARGSIMQPPPPGLTTSAHQSVCRALVLSNGALGAEGQCLGLVRALGLGTICGSGKTFEDGLHGP